MRTEAPTREARPKRSKRDLPFQPRLERPTFYVQREREQWDFEAGRALDRAHFLKHPELTVFVRTVHADELNGMQQYLEAPWTAFGDEMPWTRFKPWCCKELVAVVDREKGVIRRKVDSHYRGRTSTFFEDEFALDADAEGRR